MLRAAALDQLQVGGKRLPRLLGRVRVLGGVVADLESHLVQAGDLVPGHVAGLVRRKVETLGDEECPAKAELLQPRRDVGCMGLGAVVKGEDDEFVGDGSLLTSGGLNDRGNRKEQYDSGRPPSHDRHGSPPPGTKIV